MKRIHWLISDFYFRLFMWSGRRNIRWFKKFINHEERARIGCGFNRSTQRIG